MVGNLHGFHHEVTEDYVRSGFDMGHRGSVDQERTLHTDLGNYLCGEVGRYLHSRGCGMRWSAGFGSF